MDANEAYVRARSNEGLHKIANQLVLELRQAPGWTLGQQQQLGIRDAFEELLEDALACRG